ncbi:hypothetical protein [Pseudomonas sp. PS01301]|uniref:hypothetical protein n=1 Tax=Pseudomonas sp. PS01301 TaxID=2991437 RepID=UPI00249B002F|nr:hypothetical protein [Pseudomonas sp. PS01301]
MRVIQFFKALFKQTGSVTINGVTYRGNSVVVSGNIVGGDLNIGTVTIDGKRQQQQLHLGASIAVRVMGDVSQLDCGAGDVKVSGSVGSLKTGSGNVECRDVQGDVASGSGNVSCGHVGGSVRTGSGNVSTRRR